MSHVLGDESLGGWVDDELGLILNPQGRDRSSVGPDRAGEAARARASRRAAEEAHSAMNRSESSKQRA